MVNFFLFASGLASFLQIFIYRKHIKNYFLMATFWSPNLVIFNYIKLFPIDDEKTFALGFSAWLGTFFVLFALHRTLEKDFPFKVTLVSLFMMLAFFVAMINAGTLHASA